MSKTSEEELFELLQTKRADILENNEDDSVKGEMEVHDDPEHRAEGGQVDSLWGEKGVKEPAYFSSGVREEHRKGRQGVLDLSFDGKAGTGKSDQAAVAQLFDHGKSGDFTTHSVQLQGKSIEKISHPRTRTLQERVVRVVGRI